MKKHQRRSLKSSERNNNINRKLQNGRAKLEVYSGNQNFVRQNCSVFRGYGTNKSITHAKQSLTERLRNLWHFHGIIFSKGGILPTKENKARHPTATFDTKLPTGESRISFRSQVGLISSFPRQMRLEYQRTRIASE